MGKFTKEAYICIISIFWAVIVVLVSLFDVLDMKHRENFFDIFCKVATTMLGVVQFMVSTKLLGFTQHYQEVESRSSTRLNAALSWARTYYFVYLLNAIVMTVIFTAYYMCRKRSYYHVYWGFTYYDMIIYLNIAVFIAFTIFHNPPPTTTTASGPGIQPNPNGRMNREWIAREVIVPERVIVTGFDFGKEKPVFEEKPVVFGIKSTQSDLPYARMNNNNNNNDSSFA